jgi:LmbE family N-acetylglucosaminyl deacetylase
MIRFRKILAIGAHPDDIEYGCFGFLLRNCNESEISLYIASLGSVGDPTTGKNRKEESLEAFKLIKPKAIRFREEHGIQPENFNSVLNEMTSVLAEVQPDLILCLGPHDTHQEHRQVYEATIAAARRSKASILAYGILSNTLDFKPLFFIDISQVYETKKQALKYHRSQQHRQYMTDEYLDIFHSHTYTSLHGMRYCEAFEVIRLFV